MKTKLITETTAKEFNPFKIEIVVETIQEARTIFHLTNCGIAARLVYDNYNHGKYSKDYLVGVPSSISGDIKEEVESQGFKI